jgi:hypothetical protein
VRRGCRFIILSWVVIFPTLNEVFNTIYGVLTHTLYGHS